MKKGTGYVPSGQAQKHNFAMVPSASIPRSVFNRSHCHKTTFNEGYLIPVLVDEVLPGDTFTCKMTAFARLSTLLYPIMDNLYLESFFFFVPNRLIWTHWEQFNGYQANTGDSTSYTVPTVTASNSTGFAVGSLYDYFGMPTAVNSLVVDNFVGRAYNLIWNEWFRDQNLQNSVTVDTGDGPDTVTNYVLLQRGKRHDYFTSCLPWPQKVNDGTSINVPLSGTAPITGIGWSGTATLGTSGTVRETASSSVSYANYAQTTGGNPLVLFNGSNTSTSQPQIFANLAAASGITINQLRQSFQMQKMFERDARGGTRYIEIIRSHFGVISPDMRLQRPEYLGGGHSPWNIQAVPQTSATGLSGGSTAQADLAAYGTLSASGHGFTKSFVEHGVLIGLVCVRADITYQQGLNRMHSRQTRYDFYWPSFSHLGEQAVLNKEIYCDGSGNDPLTFGYQERYAEYRYKPSMVTGEFRSTYSSPLDAWHLAQKFTTLPTLGSSFIVENAPLSRVLASGAVPQFLFDSYFEYKCARPMPVRSAPGLIDHF